MTPTLVAVVVAIGLALTRLVPLTEPLWAYLKAPYRLIPPLVIVVAGAVVGIVGDPAQWLDQSAIAVTAIVALVAPGLNTPATKRALAKLAKLGLIVPLGFVLFGCVRAVGPLSPSDLPESMVCVSFVVGSPPVVTTAFCAGGPDAAAEVDRFERDYSAQHPKARAVR